MDYEPEYQNFDGYLQAPEGQPGLPGLQAVNNPTKQGRNRLWGQIHEEPMKSASIIDKINEQLAEELADPQFKAEQPDEILNEMMRMASGSGFASPHAFAKYLTEGAMFNITKLASSYIGLPAGEYIVWNISPEVTMLVPSEQVSSDPNMFAESPKPIEIHTSKLYGLWDKIEHTLSEDDDEPIKAIGHKERITRSKSKYPRDPKVSGGFEASGKSQEDLAAACGVEPPQISRIKNKSGEGARDPSLPVAVCLAKQSGKSVEDMFGGAQQHQQRGATSGAGKGKSSPYQRGQSESRVQSGGLLSESVQANTNEWYDAKTLLDTAAQMTGKKEPISHVFTENNVLAFYPSEGTSLNILAEAAQRTADARSISVGMIANGKPRIFRPKS